MCVPVCLCTPITSTNYYWIKPLECKLVCGVYILHESGLMRACQLHKPKTYMLCMHTCMCVCVWVCYMYTHTQRVFSTLHVHTRLALTDDDQSKEDIAIPPTHTSSLDTSHTWHQDALPPTTVYSSPFPVLELHQSVSLVYTHTHTHQMISDMHTLMLSCVLCDHRNGWEHWQSQTELLAAR